MEDKIVSFYGGLRPKIQDIVYHKKICSVNRLFQLAMLAEKELQGCQQKNHTNIGNNFNQIFNKGGASICEGQDCDKASGCFHSCNSIFTITTTTHTHFGVGKTLNHAKIVQK